MAAIWYEDQHDGLGADFLAEYEFALDIIEHAPLQFPRLETMPSTVNIRRCTLQRFPYILIFESSPQETVVLAVAHTSRRPNYWSGRRP